MKIRATLFLAVMVTAGVAHADTKKADEKYCSSLSALKGDLQELWALRDESNAREARMIIDRIDRDSREVEHAGAKINTQAGKQFMAAAERLKVEGRAVSEDMTMGQLRTRMREDVSNLELSARQLSAEAGCPMAMPQRPGEANQPAGGQPRTY
jgi:hypothetical protein